MRHLSGFGGGRYPLAGHIGPALRRGVVAVCHSTGLGGAWVRAAEGVGPYGGVSWPYTIRPAWVVVGTFWRDT